MLSKVLSAIQLDFSLAMAQHNPMPQVIPINGHHVPMNQDYIALQRFHPATQQPFPPAAAPAQACNLQSDIARAVELINKMQSKERVPDDKLQKLKEVIAISVTMVLHNTKCNV